MADILEFKKPVAPFVEQSTPQTVHPPRKISGPKKDLASIKVYTNGEVETTYLKDEYLVVRYMARAMMSLIGMSNTTPTDEDQIVISLVRSLNDIIEIQTPTEYDERA